MKVLAIGAAGFLGSFIVRELLEKGCEVSVLDFKEQAVLPAGAVYVRGDVTDFSQLLAAMSEIRPEVVINLAGLLTTMCAREPYKAMNVNVMGMANALEAARLTGVRRFVLSSSAGVCSPDRVDTREERSVSANVSMYGAGKFMCEILAREFRRNYGLDVVCLRFSLIYGPGTVATPGNAMRIKIIESCVTPRDVVIDDARATDRFHLCHVSDAAHAAVLASTVPGPLQTVYNISGIPADFLSFQELSDILHEICPQAGTVVFTGQGEPVEYGMYLHDKARRDMGYIPQYTARRGLEENVRAARGHSRG